MNLGGSPGMRDEYRIDDGAVVVRPQAGGTAVIVGGAGDGALRLGGGDSRGGALFQPRGPDSPRPMPVALPGVASPPPPSLIVRSNPDGSGLIEGWGGAIGDGGAFVNNGRVIADGGGRDRDLMFLGYGAVTNTIDNDPAGGRNGWFSRNGGRLFLPKIGTAVGTHTYTWGEDPADPTLDLVNSVRFTLRDALNPGKVDISLLDKTRADVPALPTGHTFIGIWSLDTGLTKPAGGVDLTVRYDDGLARDLGLSEANLKLWQYDDGQWLRINDASFARDLANHLLAGHASPTASFFAVSAPEPATPGTVIGASLLLLRRRRRTTTARSS
jgi:hypothetical protein